MKRVCLNRLKSEAIALSNLITSLDSQGSGLVQEVFESIFKLCASEKDLPFVIPDSTNSFGGIKRNNNKEVLKMVVGLMIEDIWSNFDNYKL